MISLQLTSNPIATDLERLIDKIDNPGPRQRRMIGGAIRQQFQSNFSNQRSGNGPWPALAPSTVADRRRQGFAGNRPILVRTGSLRSSYVDEGSSDHSSRVFRAGGFTVYEEGTLSDVARYHERGGARLPQRSVTLLDDGQENRIFQIVELMVQQVEREVLR